jgi:DNA-binding helix-hairpin-helix protein with protein kinase domain
VEAVVFLGMMPNFILVITISILEVLLSGLLAVPAIIVISLVWCVVFADDWRAKWIRYKYKKLYEKIRRKIGVLKDGMITA